MKAFPAVVLLASLGLLAEANLKHLKPRVAVMPVNPMYTAQEWQDIYGGQKLSPIYPPIFKQGTEPQQEYAGKVDVPLDDEHQRITNGIIAAPCQFPWQVSVIIDNANFCGGSLISSQWVLTVAHCAGRSYQVGLGSNDWNPPGSLTSTTTIVHEQYNFPNNDIALIKLPINVIFTPCIQPIRLCSSVPGNVANVRVSGWGRTSDSISTISPILMYADLTVIKNTDCANVYGKIITPFMICTSTVGGVGPCNSDSGGPLVYLEKDSKYTQVGIVSFVASVGCERGFPAGFTRVSSYLNWIRAKTGIALCK